MNTYAVELVLSSVLTTSPFLRGYRFEDVQREVCPGKNVLPSFHVSYQSRAPMMIQHKCPHLHPKAPYRTVLYTKWSKLRRIPSNNCIQPVLSARGSHAATIPKLLRTSHGHSARSRRPLCPLRIRCPSIALPHPACQYAAQVMLLSGFLVDGITNRLLCGIVHSTFRFILRLLFVPFALKLRTYLNHPKRIIIHTSFVTPI